jgi:hypothetical protein
MDEVDPMLLMVGCALERIKLKLHLYTSKVYLTYRRGPYSADRSCGGRRPPEVRVQDARDRSQQ